MDFKLQYRSEAEVYHLRFTGLVRKTFRTEAPAVGVRFRTRRPIFVQFLELLAWRMNVSPYEHSACAGGTPEIILQL